MSSHGLQSGLVAVAGEDEGNLKAHQPGSQKPYPAAGDNDLRYLLYAPPQFNELPEQRWPVLCFLHGAGEAAANNAGADQSIEAVMKYSTPAWHGQINSPLIRDFIVVSPQRPVRGPWLPRDFENVEKILQRIYTTLRGDPDRSFLTGFSYGAQAVFDWEMWAEQHATMAPSKRVRWRALWPVDDAKDHPRVTCAVQRVWLHFGTWKPAVQLQTVDNLKLADAGTYRSARPVQDRLFSDYRSVDYGHGATCAAAYADWRVYKWLLAS